ncbi:MAG: hypothetical protein PSY14_00600 [bacterium]|nr:hypothetical protein [bacterium]
MLRLFLGTLFLLSLSFPLIAEYILVRRPRNVAPEPFYGRYSQPPAGASFPDFSAHSAMTVSVIYPGLVVLMTMAAYYFLRVMEPRERHDHPAFIRTALALSAVWVCGFYPFLSSALGGVLFGASAIACIAAWLVMRRFDVLARPFERVVVFWSFFFFSIILALLVTGNGPQISAGFSRVTDALQYGAGQMVPLLLLAIHAAALLAVAKLLGWRWKPGTSPELALTLKVLSIAGIVLLLDVMIVGIQHGSSAGWWISLPLIALPSIAYYGVYWLVKCLPPPLRGHVTLGLFATLAVFLALLACMQAGVTGATIFLGSAGLGIVAATALGIFLLWKSDADVNIKVTITASFGFFLLVLAVISK